MWQKNVHYLDYNASSGLSLRVKQTLMDLLKNEEILLANPSSRHRPGQRMQHYLYEASRVIARSFGEGAKADQLIFCSSGTEANQSVIRSLAQASGGMIIGAGEHSASHDLLESLNHPFKYELSLLREGSYDLTQLEYLLSFAKESGLETVGVSLFWANNETGALLQLDHLRTVIEKSPVKVLLHLDAAQVWGKIEINADSTPADYLTASSHKIGAPAGVGVVWKRDSAPWSALIPGAQNRGKRAGTENVLGILALRAACEDLSPGDFWKKTEALRDALEVGLKKIDSRIQIWAENGKRLSNTTRFSVPGFHQYENWVELLDLRGFAVSHGSACKARVVEPSRVLLKMGASREEALNSVRVSLGPENTLDEVHGFLKAFEEILRSKEQQS
jgi:cysteine desulfurase